MDSLNIILMDVDRMIQEDNLLEVTSTFIKENSTDLFHEDGLFSERIFGELASPDRMIKMGYIELGTQVIHPIVYSALGKLGNLYHGILHGEKWAKFNKADKDFVEVGEDEEGAQTGYAFFIKHFLDFEPKEGDGIRRNTKVDVIKKYKNYSLIDKIPVLPAGFREYEEQGKVSSTEEVNTIYRGLINLSNALPERNISNPIYDGVKVSLQRKMKSLFDYIWDILDGKNGFLQSKYGARNIALGTRNVISAADTSVASPDNPQFIKSDETQVPLFQAAKAFQPLVINRMKTAFFSPIIDDGSSQVAVIDPKTYQLVYADISPDEKNKYITTDGLEDYLTAFKPQDIRHKPAMLKSTSKKLFYLYLIYKDGSDYYLFRDMNALKNQFKVENKEFDLDKVKPITHSELIYVATHLATQGKHVTITRYPITGVSSIYASKVHLITTKPSKQITLRYVNNPHITYDLNHWPTYGAASIDSLILHPFMLPGLGGDFDGDMVNMNPVISNQANEECREYNNSPAAVIANDGRLSVGLNSDICQLTLLNLSRV